jgi:hypothetical protein
VTWKQQRTAEGSWFGRHGDYETYGYPPAGMSNRCAGAGMLAFGFCSLWLAVRRSISMRLEASPVRRLAELSLYPTSLSGREPPERHQSGPIRRSLNFEVGGCKTWTAPLLVINVFLSLQRESKRLQSSAHPEASSKTAKTLITRRYLATFGLSPRNIMELNH